MSADNCIAILKTTDKFKVEGNVYHNTFGEGVTAYRVAHIRAAENFDWYSTNEIHNLGAWMQSEFGDCKVFYDSDEAHKFAVKMLGFISYVEYGIVALDASKWNFPGC